MNLAQRLLKAGVLTPEQLAPALYRQKRNRAFLSKHLLDLELVEPEVLKRFLDPDPPIPETLKDTGLSQTLLIQLFLKHAYYRDTFTIREMTQDLRIPPKLLEPLIAYLKTQNLLFARPRDTMGSRNRMPMEMYYALTEQGRTSAEQALEANRYVGPAPVPLDDYWDWVERQTIHQVKVGLPRLPEQDWPRGEQRPLHIHLRAFGKRQDGDLQRHRERLRGRGLYPLRRARLRPDHPAVR